MKSSSFIKLKFQVFSFQNFKPQSNRTLHLLNINLKEISPHNDMQIMLLFDFKSILGIRRAKNKEERERIGAQIEGLEFQLKIKTTKEVLNVPSYKN